MGNIEIDDVLQFIRFADSWELGKIKNSFLLGDEDEYHSAQIFNMDNLYEREKILLLKEAARRYNLEELHEKLDINPRDTLNGNPL